MTASRADSEDDRTVTGSDEETALLVPPKRTPLPKLQLSILLLAQLCEPLCSTVIYPFMPELISKLDITGGDERKVGYYVGLIESLFFATGSLTVLHWSRFSDHNGRKIVLMIGLSGLAISLVSFGLSTTFWGLVVSRCISGVLNGNSGVMKSMMAEITDTTNRADGFALIPAVWAVGATIGPVIGGQLARPADRFPGGFNHPFWQRYPYLLPCITSASVIGLTAVVIAIFLKETVHRHKPAKPLSESENLSYGAVMQGEGAPEGPPSSDKPLPLRELLTERVVISIANYCTLALLDILIMALRLLFFALPVEIGGLGFSPSTIGALLGSYGFASGFFQIFFFGRTVRRWGPKRVFVAGVFAVTPLFMLFPVMNTVARHWGRTPLVWALVATQFALSTIMDMAYGCSALYITSAAPSRRALGATHGLSQSTVGVARAIGPAFSTSLFAFSIEHGILGGYGVYVVMVAVSGGALLLAARLPRELWKDEEGRQ